MLRTYTFSNFQSFRDETTVSLLLGNKSSFHGWVRSDSTGQRISTALAIFGANASGKTGLLKPLVFSSWFMNHSFSLPADEEIPFLPHFSIPNEPFEIEIEGSDEFGTIWRYVLRATTKRVLHEALYRKVNRYSYVFIRDWSEESNSYVVKQKGFGFKQSEATKVRQNASLISTAKQYGVEIHAPLQAISASVTNIDYYGRQFFQSSHSNLASEFFSQNDDLRNKMINLIKKWDMGISDIKLRELEVHKQDGGTSKRWVWSGVHEMTDGSAFELPMEQESSGTQSAFVLLWKILYSLQYGLVVAIDEMESDLHPLLVQQILSLFSYPESNPHNAQIIFTCHSLSVLDVLQKAQVYFVEKFGCISEAFRGDDIYGLRPDDNLRAKYETGALGAIPVL